MMLMAGLGRAADGVFPVADTERRFECLLSGSCARLPDFTGQGAVLTHSRRQDYLSQIVRRLFLARIGRRTRR